MLPHLLLRPTWHGLVGPLDEILTLLPLVIGIVLLVYLYFTARQGKRRAKRHPDDSPPGDDPADL